MAITGNPKRLFVSAKDRVLHPDPFVSKQAVKDGFNQVERFLNTRGVSAQVIPGGSITATTSNQAIPFSPVTTNWDTGNIISLGTPNGDALRAPEPGIYEVSVSLLLIVPTNPDNFFGIITHYLSTDALASNGGGNISFSEFDTWLVSTGAWNISWSAQFNLNTRDYVTIRAHSGGAAGNTVAANYFALTKISDLPSKYGQ